MNKAKVTTTLKKHNTIGIDLVAMCVNDLIVARATFFLDYHASGKPDIDVAKSVVGGIQGAEQAVPW